MKLTKVHRILKFKQSNYFKKIVDFNTEKRKNAIKKNFYLKKTFLNLKYLVKILLLFIK